MAKKAKRDKVFLVSSNSKEASSAIHHVISTGRSKLLVENSDNVVFCETRLIGVFGGDSTMLGAMNDYHKHGIPFLGFNYGNVGALMNPTENLCAHMFLGRPISYFRPIVIRPLKVIVPLNKGRERELFAFNDVVFKSEQGVCQGTVEGERYPRHHFRGDGLIICTPSGSTAYSRSAGGSLFPLELNAVGITSICSIYNPIRTVERAQEFVVRFTPRSQVSVEIDGKKVGNAESARVSLVESGRKATLLYLPDYDLEVMRYKVPEPPKN